MESIGSMWFETSCTHLSSTRVRFETNTLALASNPWRAHWKHGVNGSKILTTNGLWIRKWFWKEKAEKILAANKSEKITAKKSLGIVLTAVKQIEEEICRSVDRSNDLDEASLNEFTTDSAIYKKSEKRSFTVRKYIQSRFAQSTNWITWAPYRRFVGLQSAHNRKGRHRGLTATDRREISGHRRGPLGSAAVPRSHAAVLERSCGRATAVCVGRLDFENIG